MEDWVLQELSNNHECETNCRRVIAEKLKHEMKELVRSDPVGDKENIIVMDSDNMEEGWKDQIEKVNPNSEYDWDRVSDDMRDIENEYHKDDDNEEEMGNQESVNLNLAERNLPKRVLAYSSLKLLRQLSRNLKYFLNQVHFQIFLHNFFFILHNQ